MRKTIIVAIALSAILLVVAAATAFLWFGCARSAVTDADDVVLLIDSDDTTDSIASKVFAFSPASNASCSSFIKRRLFTFYSSHFAKTPVGRYVIHRDDCLYDVYKRIRNRQQDPLRLRIPPVRFVGDYPKLLSKHLLLEASDLSAVLADSVFIDSLGFTTATLPAMFIPDTYEVWWTTSARSLLCRLHREWQSFWNAERTRLAAAAGLSPVEVATLASIVDSETAADSEKPIIAGLYINRLQRGMLLQSDPTVIFAIGDYSVHRVLHSDLTIDSPYNTYRYPGLPPGPIRVPSRAALEAVLHYAHHNYLYMCAKEDFSGTHSFARTLSEHGNNARRYTAALKARGIRR